MNQQTSKNGDCGLISKPVEYCSCPPAVPNVESEDRNEDWGLGYLDCAVEAPEDTTSNSQHGQHQQTPLGETADWNWGKDKASKFHLLFSRPQKVCLCPFLPLHPLHISTHLYIIQHPAEENKVLRTVPLLTACLPQDKCKVKIGRRFSEERDPELSTVCRKSDTLILYPGAEAANLEEFILDSPIYPSTIIIIDGTWSQAKDIFYKNSLFRLPKQVQLKTSISSQYVIRTQPTNRCLSTLECAAAALSILEKNNYIQETLLRPLQALCSFQLQHGAQIRLSKEHLLKNGLYPKPMPKNKRKLRRMELLMNSVKI
nr:tRNA-uridine aminocarboxypropyltransferase 2 [Mirounga angustirostris]